MRAKRVGAAVVHLIVVQVKEAKGQFTLFGSAPTHHGPGSCFVQTSHTIRIQFIILGFVQTAITDAPRRVFQRPSNDFQGIFARVNFEEQAVRSIQVAFII